MNRKGMAVVAGAILLSVPFGLHAASAAADPEPPTSCEPSALRLPDGFDQAIGTATSPDGKYVAGRVYDDSAHPALWTDGEPREIQVPGTDAQLRSVNNAGVVVGVSIVDDQWNPAPWVYRDGKGSILPGVGGEGEARAINGNGDIAGVRLVEVPAEPPNPPGAHSFPVRWDGETGKVERLPVPDGTTNVYVGGITEDGTVVGIDHTKPPARVYAWPKDGERYELTAPEGELRPYSITAAGSKVVADSETANGNLTVLWDLAELDDPVVVTKRIQYVDAVNTHGWVVGNAADDTAVFSSLAGGDLELPPLEDADSAVVSALTEDGRTLVGSSSDANGNTAVVWTCS